MLKAFSDGENLIISITDNGIGMTDDEIKKAAETISSENSLLSGKHIGLANVNQIKLNQDELCDLFLHRRFL